MAQDPLLTAYLAFLNTYKATHNKSSTKASTQSSTKKKRKRIRRPVAVEVPDWQEVFNNYRQLYPFRTMATQG